MLSSIAACFSTLDGETRVKMRCKFDVCYLMAKENIPFVKYPALLDLETRHGVDLGLAYSTPVSAQSFTSYIAQSLRAAFVDKLSTQSRFFSFSMGGTTDAGNLEDELVVITYSFKNDSTKEMTTNARYWSVHNPERADADGLLLCIKDAFKPLGVSDLLDKASVLGVQNMPVLVGGRVLQ